MKKYLLTLFLLMAVIPAWASSKNNAPSIVGNDDRKEITYIPKGLEGAAVVIRIESSGQFCSGAMVGPNIVLTAAHCLDWKGKFKKEAVVFAVATDKNKINVRTSNKDIKDNQNSPILQQFTFPIDTTMSNDSIASIATAVYRTAEEKNKNTSLSSPPLNFGSCFSATGTKIFVPTSYHKAYTNPADDYGFLILDEPIGNTIGYFALKEPKPEEIKDAKIVIIGRPGDKPIDTLWESPGHIGKIDKNYNVHFDADVLPGNSGGPILLEENPYEIIGIFVTVNSSDKYVEGGYPNNGILIRESIILAVQELQKNPEQEIDGFTSANINRR